MLTHQIIDRDDVSPLVIDCIRGKYCAAQDSVGNIYLLFYSETQKSWGIKRYMWSIKDWEDFVAIDVLDGCRSAFLYIDGDDEMHIVFDIDSCIREYHQGKSAILGTGQNPLMLLRGEELIIWEGKLDNKIYVKRRGEDAPTVFMSGGFTKPSVFKLRYTSYEPNINADRCPGYITNGAVKTYGITDFFVTAKSPVSKQVSTVSTQPAEQKNDNMYLELQKIKIQLAQLGNIVEQIKLKADNIDTEVIEKRISELESVTEKMSASKLWKIK